MNECSVFCDVDFVGQLDITVEPVTIRIDLSAPNTALMPLLFIQVAPSKILPNVFVAPGARLRCAVRQTLGPPLTEYWFPPGPATVRFSYSIHRTVIAPNENMEEVSYITDPNERFGVSPTPASTAVVVSVVYFARRGPSHTHKMLLPLRYT